MPHLLTVRVKRPGGRPIRIWVPVLPVVLVFSLPGTRIDVEQGRTTVLVTIR